MEMERRPAAARRRMDAPRRRARRPSPRATASSSRAWRLRVAAKPRRLGLLQTRPGVIDAETVSRSRRAGPPARRRRRDGAAPPPPRGGEMGAGASPRPLCDGLRKEVPHGTRRLARGHVRAHGAREAPARRRARGDAPPREGPRSILHPERVGVFAMDDAATRDAERAFAEWRRTAAERRHRRHRRHARRGSLSLPLSLP